LLVGLRTFIASMILHCQRLTTFLKRNHLEDVVTTINPSWTAGGRSLRAESGLDLITLKFLSSFLVIWSTNRNLIWSLNLLVLIL